ncbi:hypothetical protein H4R24_000079 [Coemansia sp. RSA 988]|nr:hypothetical protein H4R24_000079 [Coemansia sp. RSA 988]
MTKVATTTKTSRHFSSTLRSAAHSRLYAKAVVPETIDDDIETTKHFPESLQERKLFVSPQTHRPVTEFQYKVYDTCRQIPLGYYSTYKALADHLGSGPRAVGNALSKNPFCPLPIPCHRVLTSDRYIGGFSGDKTSKIFFKKAKLEKEGLKFDESGFLCDNMQQSRFFGEFK